MAKQLKRTGPLYIINGKGVSEQTFREQEPIFKYQTEQQKIVNKNVRDKLNAEILKFINIASSDLLKNEYTKLLNMPDSTYAELNKKIFLFNGGELRSEDEIEEYENKKYKDDFVYSNSFDEYCKSHHKKHIFSILPIAITIIGGFISPIFFLLLVVTIPISMLISSSESKHTAELHIDYGISHGMDRNDLRIKRKEKEINDAKAKKVAALASLTAAGVNSKRAVDYIKDPDKWHQI